MLYVMAMNDRIKARFNKPTNQCGWKKLCGRKRSSKNMNIWSFHEIEKNIVEKVYCLVNLVKVSGLNYIQREIGNAAGVLELVAKYIKSSKHQQKL
jgi:hypothetical protein